VPIFINEIRAEIPQAPVPNVQSEAVHEQVPVTQPEYDFLKNLMLIEERRQRLQFD
jgi:hypothetical protein